MAGTWGGTRQTVQKDFQISARQCAGGEAFPGRQAGVGRDDTESGLRWVGLGLQGPMGVSGAGALGALARGPRTPESWCWRQRRGCQSGEPVPEAGGQEAGWRRHSGGQSWAALTVGAGGSAGPEGR